MILRVRKQDSAYLYQLLESYEGLVGFSTLPHERDQAFRDIILHIAPDLRSELERVLERLREEVSFELLPSENG